MIGYCVREYFLTSVEKPPLRPSVKVKRPNVKRPSISVRFLSWTISRCGDPVTVPSFVRASIAVQMTPPSAVVDPIAVDQVGSAGPETPAAVHLKYRPLYIEGLTISPRAASKGSTAV